MKSVNSYDRPLGLHKENTPLGQVLHGLHGFEPKRLLRKRLAIFGVQLQTQQQLGNMGVGRLFTFKAGERIIGSKDHPRSAQYGRAPKNQIPISNTVRFFVPFDFMNGRKLASLRAKPCR